MSIGNYLPNNIKHLVITDNPITKFDTLPTQIDTLQITYNKQDCRLRGKQIQTLRTTGEIINDI